MIEKVEEKKLWFRAKRYGYGWVPVTWQGWGVIVMYLFVILTDALFVDNHSHSVSDSLMTFFPHWFILTVFLIIICDARGERAKWRWGK